MAKKVVCIAGKSAIAVRALYHINRIATSDIPILAVPVDGDDGVDRWQPSMLKHAKQIGGRVRVVDLEEVQSAKDGIFLSLEYDRIINTDQFNGLSLYNIHFSKLPAYKGMYTSFHPIINSETEGGCTLHRIDNGIDTGDVADQIVFSIDQEETAKTLYAKYVKYGFSLLVRNFDRLISGNVQFQQQPAEGATYFSKRSVRYDRIEINLRSTADQIRRQINAYNHRSFQLPMVSKKNISAVKISSKRSTGIPGRILSETDTGVHVSTIDYDCELVVDRFDELLRAVEQGSIQIIGSVLQGNPSLANESDGRGWTPLIKAAYLGRSESLSYLIECGADANLPNQKGTTPLMYAKDFFLSTGDGACILILLREGAELSATDMTGRSVFDYLLGDDLIRFNELIGSGDPNEGGTTR